MQREEKARENRLRAKAQRQHMILTRSRRRSPDAITYGKYFLSDLNNNLLTPNTGLTLDEIETHLADQNGR